MVRSASITQTFQDKNLEEHRNSTNLKKVQVEANDSKAKLKNKEEEDSKSEDVRKTVEEIVLPTVRDKFTGFPPFFLSDARETEADKWYQNTLRVFVPYSIF